MTVVGTLTTRLTADIADHSKGIQQANKDVGGFEKNVSGMGNVVKFVAAGAIGGALVGGLKASIKAAAEAEQVMALTQSTIKATGGAAGFTADQIADLSLEHSRLTGIEDEVVQSGNNMLLTFKEIGGDTFPRASKAMQDMAVSMNKGSLEGIDLKGTAIQLGKALNDPIKGVTALTKVGVTFTQEQKNAIKAMVEANDTAGAQALILAELESEFGGAAVAAGNTYAGAQAKLNNELGNMAEIVGGAVIPEMAEAASQGTEWLIAVQALHENYEDGNITLLDYIGTVLNMGQGVNASTVIAEQALLVEEDLIDTRRESIDALNDATAATNDYANSTNDAKLELLKFSDAAVGAMIIEALHKALEEGEIDFEEYEKQVRAVWISYMDVTASQADFSIELSRLKDDLDKGKISAKDYIDELNRLQGKYEVNVHTSYTSSGIPSQPPKGGKAVPRQHGGKVGAGRPYIVGEAGMEMFIPDVSGYVVSNKDLMNALKGLQGGNNYYLQGKYSNFETEQDTVSRLRMMEMLRS